MDNLRALPSNSSEIERYREELRAAESALVAAQRKFIEFDKHEEHQACMNAAYRIRLALKDSPITDPRDAEND